MSKNWAKENWIQNHPETKSKLHIFIHQKVNFSMGDPLIFRLGKKSTVNKFIFPILSDPSCHFWIDFWRFGPLWIPRATVSDGQSFVRVHVSVSFFFLLSRLGPALAMAGLPKQITLRNCVVLLRDWEWLAGHARPLFDWEKVFSARFITFFKLSCLLAKHVCTSHGPLNVRPAT